MDKNTKFRMNRGGRRQVGGMENPSEEKIHIKIT